MAYFLTWVGYGVGVVALFFNLLIIFLISLSGFHVAWDYILLIALILLPIVSLILAYKWPFISGVLFITTGLFVGTTIITLNVWIAIFFALPVLVVGLSFFISGILLWIKELSLLRVPSDLWRTK